MFTPYCAICKSGHFLTDPHKWPEDPTETVKPAAPIQEPIDPWSCWRPAPSVWKFE